jgi:diguanylate cyclase (GGDEF)-like protein
MRVERGELDKLKVLEGVNFEAVERALGACKVLELAVGHVLLTMGEANSVMYMILSGRLSVHVEAGAGGEAVAFIEAGETVGELSVLDARPASAHVIVAEPARLLAVDHTVFWGLVDASHDFAINLLALLAQRLRANNSTVANNMRLQREYKRNALVDALTGLHNRRWLDEALPRFVKRHARSTEHLGLLMIDVDHFKKFNDTFGHPAGDAVLVAVAGVLRASVRPSDHVARYGGEEFIVLLPETHTEGISLVAERLRAAVAAATVHETSGAPLPSVTISIGGATLGKDDRRGSTELLSAADSALYESKRNGRNRASFAL